MTSDLTVYGAPSILRRSGPPVRQSEAKDTLFRSLAPFFPPAPHSRVKRPFKSLSDSTSKFLRCPKGGFTLVDLCTGARVHGITIRPENTHAHPEKGVGEGHTVIAPMVEV